MATAATLISVSRAHYRFLLTSGFIRKAEKEFTTQSIPYEIYPIINTYFDPQIKDKDSFADLTTLIYITSKTISDHINHRFLRMTRKYIYSSISSNIMLAINPFERLPIYGADIINQYHEKQKKGLQSLYKYTKSTPHPYGIAAVAYCQMIETRKNQSIVILGQSGSGKVCIHFTYLFIIATTSIQHIHHQKYRLKWQN